MLPQLLLHEPFAPLPRTEALILAFYALNAALQPTGVLLVCDTANLGDAVVAIDSLASSTQLQELAQRPEVEVDLRSSTT